MGSGLQIKGMLLEQKWSTAEELKTIEKGIRKRLDGLNTRHGAVVCGHNAQLESREWSLIKLLPSL